MIILYQFATSPFTEKVRRALNFKGLNFEVHEVERAEVGNGKYSEVSPTGKFPAIKDGDTVVWDSTDIIFYLDKTYPERPLIPTLPSLAGQAHAIEEWADESLYFYEMTMRLSWEHNLENALDEFAQAMPGVPKPQLKELIMAGVSQLTTAQGIGKKPREQVIADCVRHFEALDNMLTEGEFLLDELCYADLAVIGQINALLYAKEAKQALNKCKYVKDWISRIDALAPK